MNFEFNGIKLIDDKIINLVFKFTQLYNCFSNWKCLKFWIKRIYEQLATGLLIWCWQGRGEWGPLFPRSPSQSKEHEVKEVTVGDIAVARLSVRIGVMVAGLQGPHHGCQASVILKAAWGVRNTNVLVGIIQISSSSTPP